MQLDTYFSTRESHLFGRCVLQNTAKTETTGDAFAKSGLMINDVVRARLTLDGFIQGIVPGIFASVAGTLVASLTIFKRSEENLFRELEAG